MSAHLTHEELTDTLSGISSLTVNAHLLNCPECASEMDQLKNSIAGFRQAAHAWSESAPTVGRVSSVVPRKRSWAATWALVATMILFAAGVIFYLRDYEARKQAESAQVAMPAAPLEGSAAQIAKDNELMSQVYSEISEGVPAPMQPLQISQSAASNDSAAK
jgi:anti-sigma factor RsiW